MSDKKRNMVNIMSVCEANMADAFAKIEAAKKAKEDAESEISSIQTRHQAEIAADNTELSKVERLIQEMTIEGVPTEKLEKKANDIREKTRKRLSEHESSRDLSAARAAILQAEKDLSIAHELHERCKLQQQVAIELKQSYDIRNNVGAVEAMEFETIKEAIDEYILNIPAVVRITEDLEIDRVAFWHVPYAAEPFQLKISASKGKFYSLNRMPQSLSWLKEFLRSPYVNMQVGDVSSFQAGGVAFKMVDAADEAEDDYGDEPETEAQETPGRSWVGKMDAFFTQGRILPPSVSVYAPDGPKTYNRSGLCFIKSEGRFYATWNTRFPGAKVVREVVTQTNSYGNTYQQERDVIHDIKIDASALMDSFFEPMIDQLKTEVGEFQALAKAKSPLAVRIATAIQGVGSLESAFEPRNKRLTAGEINKEVGAYWDAFVNSPWEGTIRGDVAMIKHLCERKIETPHVWSYSIKGHYGLRVRTRDHDWITATIYCPPSGLSPKDPISPDDVQYCTTSSGWCTAHIRVGPCYIKLLGRHRE